jgi:hypothetical protein
VCTFLAQRLEPGRDAYILHQALEGNCPHVLVEALVIFFQIKYIKDILHISLQSNVGASVRLLVDPYRATMDIFEPHHRLLPIEQVFLNVGNDGLIENVDAVYALLRENPAYLERVV